MLGEEDELLCSDDIGEGIPLDRNGHQRTTARNMLDSWGISTSAEDLPLVLLPAPIAFLVFKGLWKYLFLRTRWHMRLVDRHGIQYHGKPLFERTLSYSGDIVLARVLTSHTYAFKTLCASTTGSRRGCFCTCIAFCVYVFSIAGRLRMMYLSRYACGVLHNNGCDVKRNVKCGSTFDAERAES